MRLRPILFNDIDAQEQGFTWWSYMLLAKLIDKAFGTSLELILELQQIRSHGRHCGTTFGEARAEGRPLKVTVTLKK